MLLTLHHQMHSFVVKHDYVLLRRIMYHMTNIGNMKYDEIETIVKVVSLLNKGYTYSSIGLELGISYSKVFHLKKKFVIEKTYADRKSKWSEIATR